MPLQLQLVTLHPLVASYLIQMLNADPKLGPLVSRTPIDAREKMRGLEQPCLFILDMCSLPVELPEILRLLRLHDAGNRFLALVGPNEGDTQSMLRFLFLGLHGVANMATDPPAQIVNAVHEVLSGNLWIPKRVVAEYVRQTTLAFDNQSCLNRRLTARQTQIVHLLGRHQSNKEIGEALGIAQRTVKFHVSNILDKLGIQHRRQLWEADIHGTP